MLRVSFPRPAARWSVVALAALALAVGGCERGGTGEIVLPDLPAAPSTPPAWTTEAVYYEVPRAALAGAALARAAPTAADSAAADTAMAARAGAGLRALAADLDRLAGLGVTAVVLDPFHRDAGRADATVYHHVAPALGPDPDADAQALALETPDDPDTWGTTAADDLLFELVGAAHERGLRVVLEIPLGGSGPDFWAARDAADWYADAAPDSTGRRPFQSVGLEGDLADGLPLGGDLATGPKSHALAVVVRWLDPDGDGDPADGVDGIRVPGAAAVPLGFWEDLRRVVKTVSPEAVLIGDVGTASAGPWLIDALDAVPFPAPGSALGAFLDPERAYLTASDLALDLGDRYAEIPAAHLPALPTPVPDSLGALGRLLQATLPGAPTVRADADTTGLRGALRLRRAYPDVFTRGTLEWTSTDDVLRFVRRVPGRVALVVVNRGRRATLAGALSDGATLAHHVGPRPRVIGGSVVVRPGGGAVFVQSTGS